MTYAMQLTGVSDRMYSCASSRYILLLVVCLAMLYHNTMSAPLDADAVSTPDTSSVPSVRNRAGRYIFVLSFLLSSSSFFSSPNLSGRRLNVYHTSTHGVASVRI